MLVRFKSTLVLAAVLYLLAPASHFTAEASPKPRIKITDIPPASAQGSATATNLIGGIAYGKDLSKCCRVIIYAHTDAWYVQPTVASPYTPIGENGKWQTTTHPGAQYAALLVESSFKPEARIDNLPAAGGEILAEDVQPGK